MCEYVSTCGFVYVCLWLSECVFRSECIWVCACVKVCGWVCFGGERDKTVFELVQEVIFIERKHFLNANAWLKTFFFLNRSMEEENVIYFEAKKVKPFLLNTHVAIFYCSIRDRKKLYLLHYSVRSQSYTY